MRRFISVVLLMLAATVVCTAQPVTYYYPQIASGQFHLGTWKTTIFLTNALAPGGAPASGTIVLRTSDGGPFYVNLVDEFGNPAGSGYEIPFTLSAGESRKLTTVGDQLLTSGYATISANGPVMGNAMYTWYDPSGAMVGEAAVPPTIPLGKQAIFVDGTNGFTTGLAIANPNAGASLHINFQLMDTAGNVVQTTTRDLAPGQHLALYVHDLFPTMGPMVGRLQFFCTNPMVSIGLRFDAATGIFTSLSPVAIQN
jgi:hypothetical protein